MHTFLGLVRRLAKVGQLCWNPGPVPFHHLLGGVALALAWAEAVHAADGEFATGFEHSLAPEKTSVQPPCRWDLPDVFTLQNSAIRVSVNAADGRFSVLNFRTDDYRSQRLATPEIVVLDGQAMQDRIELKLQHAPSGLKLTATWRLAGEQPEFTVVLAGAGPMPATLKYPHLFTSSQGDYLILLR